MRSLHQIEKVFQEPDLDDAKAREALRSLCSCVNKLLRDTVHRNESSIVSAEIASRRGERPFILVSLIVQVFGVAMAAIRAKDRNVQDRDVERLVRALHSVCPHFCPLDTSAVSPALPPFAAIHVLSLLLTNGAVVIHTGPHEQTPDMDSINLYSAHLRGFIERRGPSRVNQLADKLLHRMNAI
jgi:hypothetical protein